MKSKAFTLLNTKSFCEGLGAARPVKFRSAEILRSKIISQGERHLTGFTLIELLVVISIIGVIASIVLVSFSGSRDKAKLAKSQQFSAQISHALGAYAVGIWRFEEGSGTTLYDESGFGNDGTFNGNPTPVFPEGVYSRTTALQFDGTDDYVSVPNSSSLNITDAITIEAWFYTSQNTNYQAIVDKKYNNPGGAFSLYLGVDAIYFATAYGGASRIKTSYSTSYVDGWHHIAATFSLAEQKQRLYFDGDEVASDDRTVVLDTNTVDLKIGSGVGDFNGTIDEVRIYEQTLSVTQIQQHYSQGVAVYGIAVK